MKRSFNTVVIGAGSGGMTVALGLAALGKDVALIESKFVGGECTNVGCIPSKSLIHLAAEPQADQHAPAVLAQVRHKRDHLRDEETEHVKDQEHLRYYGGRARLLSRTCVEVTYEDTTREELETEHVVIATGSRPRTLPLAGLPPERCLTNDNIWDEQEAPRHLAIIGAGAVGTELAFAMRKLGSDVSIITNTDRILEKSDPEASKVVADALEAQGIHLYFSAKARSYDPVTNAMHCEGADGPRVLKGVDRVLQAVGRVRNVENLGLEEVGVRHSEKGIEIDSYGQTSIGNIYAIGDVTPSSYWTHSANAQGRRVVQRIAFPWLPALSSPPIYPNAVFSDPEVAAVGLSMAEIGKRYHPSAVVKLLVPLSTTDKGYTDEVARGFILVYAMRLTGRIIGATIVGPKASEMISFFTLAISSDIPLYRLYRLVYPYPTLSGAIQKIADQFVRQTLPNLVPEIGNYLRYRWATPPKDKDATEPKMATAQTAPAVRG